MTDQEKNCFNCAHSYGIGKEYRRCGRSGYYCSTEMKYSIVSKCATEDGQPKLWSPRKSIFARIKDYFLGYRDL